MFTWIDYVLIFATLFLMIALPIGAIRAYVRPREPRPDPVRGGQAMRPNDISVWMAALFILVPWLGLLMRWRAGRDEPEFSWLNTGPMAGLGLAILATVLSLWLLWRWRTRYLWWDEERVEVSGRGGAWPDLKGVTETHINAHTSVGGPAFYAASGAVTGLEFSDGTRLKVTPDIAPGKEFTKMLKARAKAVGAPYVVEGKAPRRRKRA